jgi:hypothetical protein
MEYVAHSFSSRFKSSDSCFVHDLSVVSCERRRYPHLSFVLEYARLLVEQLSYGPQERCRALYGIYQKEVCISR